MQPVDNISDRSCANRVATALLTATLSLAGACFSGGCAKESEGESVRVVTPEEEKETTRRIALNMLTPSQDQSSSWPSPILSITEKELHSSWMREYCLRNDDYEELKISTMALNGQEVCLEASYRFADNIRQFEIKDAQLLFATYQQYYGAHQKKIDAALPMLVASELKDILPIASFRKVAKPGLGTLANYEGSATDADFQYRISVAKLFDGHVEMTLKVDKHVDRAGEARLEKEVTLSAPWLEKVISDAEHKVALDAKLTQFIENLDFNTVMAGSAKLDENRNIVITAGEYTVRISPAIDGFGPDCSAQIGLKGLPYCRIITDERINMLYQASMRRQNQND